MAARRGQATRQRPCSRHLPPPRAARRGRGCLWLLRRHPTRGAAAPYLHGGGCAGGCAGVRRGCARVRRGVRRAVPSGVAQGVAGRHVRSSYPLQVVCSSCGYAASGAPSCASSAARWSGVWLMLVRASTAPPPRSSSRAMAASPFCAAMCRLVKPVSVLASTAAPAASSAAAAAAPPVRAARCARGWSSRRPSRALQLAGAASARCAPW